MDECKNKGHRFHDNGGICIGWTGAIGSYVCRNCLATAKYGYNKTGDPVQILWIKEINSDFRDMNEEAIKEFGNTEDRLLIGLRWSILKQDFVKVRNLKDRSKE